MSQSKIALLQRQQAFQRDAINNKHKLVAICKDQIKWLKGVPDIACTQKRVDGLYKIVEVSRKRIAKLVEMQVFTKQELKKVQCKQYKPETQHKSWNFKHAPRWPFMAEAPAVEMGSVVGEEL